MPKPIPTPFTTSAAPARAEREAVHDVYEAIAPHFASTRYKPWPLVKSFLDSLPPNSFGLDSGAGNGKYLTTACENGRQAIALDMSSGLLSIAKQVLPAGAECVRAELGFEGWRSGVFDWAISIAAIHHLTTPDRRLQAVQALLHSLVMSPSAPYSRFMIYVWAYEQGTNSKRKMGATATVSDAESQETKVQDVLVPWVYQPKQPPGQEAERTVYHRYYHLFVEGELRQLVEEAARLDGYSVGEDGPRWLRIRAEGYEADNWWIQGEVGVCK